MMEKPTILIVDDEDKNIRLLKAMLMNEDYRISEASSGEQALQSIAEIKPDLILLDVMMPGIDGFKVCQKLKADDKTKMIPIVMQTALREKEHRIKAMASGADDFLSKPVDQIELLLRVKSLLRIKTYQNELFDRYLEIADKNEKLLRLEKIKEGLFHMIVHDLRNPLAALYGYIELIAMDKQNFSQYQIETLEKSMSSCMDLNEMIQSLLDIYKMEEGKLTPKKEITHFKGLIQQIIEQFVLKAAGKEVSLSFNSSENLSPLPVDRSLIRRVVANLINNAIRHTPSGGKIEVRLQPDPENGALQLSVCDTGDGLAPEYHQKIFEKFEQATLKKKGVNVGATGLGLAFCKMAVEAHHGKIWVKSDGEGKGAEFHFTLPAGAHSQEFTPTEDTHSTQKDDAVHR
jgi:signal transduction histidine kinase